MIEPFKKTCPSCFKDINENVNDCPFCGAALSEDMTASFTFKTQISITQQDVDDILSSAFDGGITYWCDRVKVIGDYLGEYASDQISRGGALLIHDAEENKSIKLTLERFFDGLEKYISLGNYHCVENNTIDTCNMDAGDADGIVQCSLFGDIIYG